ncbi:unnamed protein product [Rotaria sordida]|uniref:procollagen-proline 4-dioxygenase n=1 Tax=Rotaria sordida TaxID=392033 RepID=A0A813UQ02_9BILA|nr:unnamed protein product [Rotaria sordida]CAF0826504.1 unnamed protein product [Rotaria sordida]
MLLVHIFYLVLVKSIFVHSESFTSTTHLTHLFNTEVELSKQLQSYLKVEYERLDRIEKFLDVIKDEIRQAQGKEEIYFGNPVNAHLFIKHLTVDWYGIEEIVFDDTSKTMADNYLFPSYEDYTGSAVALMRLQDTYKLNTSEVANGEISTNYKSRKLSALECYDLGRIAYTNGDYYHTLMWMQEALDHLDKEVNNTSPSRVDILDHLAFSTSQQGNHEHALVLTKEILRIAPDHVRAGSNKIYYEDLIQKKILNGNSDSSDFKSTPTIKKMDNINIKNQRPRDYLDEREKYEQLCRQNGSSINTKRQAKLFCRYRHNNHPYLILRPAKEEQLLDEPVIYLYHDTVRDNDIQVIKDIALPRLQRAVVRDAGSNTFKPANYRISKSAWLRNEDSPVIARLSRLIEAVTNLSMATAEDLQIANYGVGGHYEPHFDFARKTEKDAFSSFGAGNRMATWLTYLSDVEKGGATVFIPTGGHVKPEKGSAVFWYNLYASGEGDYNTRHAACPVLIGNKWVGNKWIHERGQEFRRRCSLDPMA